MPYLQLEVNETYPIEKRNCWTKHWANFFARNGGQCEAGDRHHPGIRSRRCMGRCTDHEPVPAPLFMCDIRRGRPPEKRAELAKALIGACEEILGLKPDLLNVEFTQHAGDEMYHPLMGGLSEDWKPDEA